MNRNHLTKKEKRVIWLKRRLTELYRNRYKIEFIPVENKVHYGYTSQYVPHERFNGTATALLLQEVLSVCSVQKWASTKQKARRLPNSGYTHYYADFKSITEQQYTALSKPARDFFFQNSRFNRWANKLQYWYEPNQNRLYKACQIRIKKAYVDSTREPNPEVIKEIAEREAELYTLTNHYPYGNYKDSWYEPKWKQQERSLKKHKHELVS